MNKTPIEALDAATEITGWDAELRLAVTLDYIQMNGSRSMARFAAYVARRANVERYAHEIENPRSHRAALTPTPPT